MDPNGYHARTLTHSNTIYGFEGNFISADFNLPSLVNGCSWQGSCQAPIYHASMLNISPKSIPR